MRKLTLLAAAVLALAAWTAEAEAKSKGRLGSWSSMPADNELYLTIEPKGTWVASMGIFDQSRNKRPPRTTYQAYGEASRPGIDQPISAPDATAPPSTTTPTVKPRSGRR